MPPKAKQLAARKVGRKPTPSRRKAPTKKKSAPKRIRTDRNIRVTAEAHDALLAIRDGRKAAGAKDADLSDAILALSALQRSIGGANAIDPTIVLLFAGVQLDNTAKMSPFAASKVAHLRDKMFTEHELVQAALEKSGLSPAVFGRQALLEYARGEYVSTERRRLYKRGTYTVGADAAVRIPGISDQKYAEAFDKLFKKGELISPSTLIRVAGTNSYRTAERWLERNHPQYITRKPRKPIFPPAKQNVDDATPATADVAATEA